jgi:hypothetical protein
LPLALNIYSGAYGNPYSAGFDSNGNFHIHYDRGLGGKLFVLEGANRPDRLSGATQVTASADVSSVIAGTLNIAAADLATKDVSGVTMGFIQGVGGGAWAYRLSPTYEAKYIGSIFKAGSTGTLAQSFGSMFTFNNEIYAAANNGDGVYKLHLDNFDFDNPSTVVFEYMGPSISTDGNDGMNCLNGK